MNTKQITLVQDSFAKVAPISETAAELFYKRLFEVDPSLRSLFKSDMKQQGRKLMQALAFVVKGLSNTDTILPALEELARKHVDYGVRDEHYDTVGAALLWTLEQGLGKEFTSEVKSAWTEAYALLAGVMKAASARRAA